MVTFFVYCLLGVGLLLGPCSGRRNYAEDSFVAKHVYRPGKSASDYIRAYTSRGARVPHFITVLHEMPDIDDYEYKGGPNHDRRTSMWSVNSDNFKTVKVNGESTFRCVGVLTRATIDFNSRTRRPYHLHQQNFIDPDSFRERYTRSSCTKIRNLT